MTTAPPIDTVPPVPRLIRAHDQVAEHYRNEIRDGLMAPGKKLDSIRVMAEEWGGISPTTVARAIAILREEGWIDVSQGRVATVIGVPPGQK